MLVCCRVNRLPRIDRVTGEPIRRYEHDHSGSLIHVDVDVTKSATSPMAAAGATSTNSKATATGPRPSPRRHTCRATRGPLVGRGFVHTVIDDYSRVAYAEICTDEKADTPSPSCAARRPGSPTVASSSSGCSPTTGRPTSPTPEPT